MKARPLSSLPTWIAIAGLVAGTGSVSAQERRWTVEVHGGAVLTNNPTEGQGAIPAPGEPFVTQGGPSRRVTSWFFGDGARLLNDVIGLVASPGISDRMVPLDPILNSRIAERRTGASFGIRIGRAIGRRLEAEFSVDVSQSRLEIQRTVLDGVEVSRASFDRAWQALFLDEPTVFVAPHVSATTTVYEEGRQVLTSGGVNINLRTEGTLIPYLSAGAGVVSNVGTNPSVTLEGRYGFLAAGVFPLEEFDTVILRHATDDKVFVGVVGGGFKYFLNPQRGLRVDVRAHLGRNPSRTLVSATSRATATPPLQTSLFSRTTPSLQISNNPSIPSTLNGSISDFESFTGRGTSRPVSVTVGFFWRL